MPKGSSGGGTGKTGGGTGGGNKFIDITATYYDVGDDCDNIDPNKRYTPKNTAELKRLIQRDIIQQGITVNLNYINTSAITDMSSLFGTPEGATFNGDIHCWDVSGVKDVSAMFKGAKTFNGNIKDWDVSSMVNMREMFSGATSFNQDLDKWSKARNVKQYKRHV